MSNADKVQVAIVVLSVPLSFFVMPFKTAIMVNSLIIISIVLAFLFGWINIKMNEKVIRQMEEIKKMEEE